MSGLILLATGGTAGHIFPAEAVAVELIRRGRRLAIVTDRRGLRYIKQGSGTPIYIVEAGTISARGFVNKIKALASIFIGFCQACRLCKKLRPVAVISFGGYPSLPTSLAAIVLRIPQLIHEQNAVLGRANWLVSGRVEAIATSFREVSGLRKTGGPNVINTGNPVRETIITAADKHYVAPSNFGFLNLLVFGGSQGASFFSEVVPEAVISLPDTLRKRVRIIQQTRPEEVRNVESKYAAAGVAAVVTEFLDDMGHGLSQAHIIIARAGASTISEIAVAGRPSILVPYQFASDDHQTKNAFELVEAGAARLLKQETADPITICLLLSDWLVDPSSLSTSAAAAKRLGRPRAARHIANLAESLADRSLIAPRIEGDSA